MKAHPFAKFRARRVAVKIRSVRLGKSGILKVRAHLRYIQRDGATRDGTPGKLYGPQRDGVDPVLLRVELAQRLADQLGTRIEHRAGLV